MHRAAASAGDITTHYSAAESGELPAAAAEKVTDREIAQTAALTLLRQRVQGIGKVPQTKQTNNRRLRRETA
jgi:hypothetical protein